MIKEYKLNTYKEIRWEEVPNAKIDTYKWADGGYTPACFAQCALLENKGLCVKLTAFETNPKAVYKKFNDPICADSCLEFFAAFDNSSDEYVNFELNANGACLATRRRADGPITSVDELIALPEFCAQVFDDKWTVEFMLTFEQIKTMFPNSKLEKGSYFRANFYKCGDETEVRHYGMWNEIDCDPPTFHAPECFGKIVIC